MRRYTTSAQVRILEATIADVIGEVLTSDDYHVLNLAGHGAEDFIELTDEIGVAVQVSRADFTAALQASGAVVLLVLSRRVREPTPLPAWLSPCTARASHKWWPCKSL